MDGRGKSEERENKNCIDRFSASEGEIGTVILAFSIMRKLCGSIDLVTRSRDHRLSITRSSWPEASGRK